MVQSSRRLIVDSGVRGRSLSEQLGSQRISDINVRPTRTGLNRTHIPNDTVPRGIIEDIIPPEQTHRGENFHVRAIISNAGSLEGKFFFRVTIPILNIDTETAAEAVPSLTRMSIYKEIKMPNSAASLEEIEAEATISHLNEDEWRETTETKIVDDNIAFTIPGPSGGIHNEDIIDDDVEGDSADIDTAPPECFTMTLSRLFDITKTYRGVSFNNIDALVEELNERDLSINNTAIEWCPTPEENDLSVIINDVAYQPSDLRSENDTRSAAISLTPRMGVRDGEPITVVGMGFAPHETIDVILKMTTSAIDDGDDEAVSEYEGQVYTNNRSVTADSGGDFRTTIRSRNIPSGIVGEGIVSVTGIRSSKTASKTIQIT